MFDYKNVWKNITLPQVGKKEKFSVFFYGTKWIPDLHKEIVITSGKESRQKNIITHFIK